MGLAYSRANRPRPMKSGQPAGKRSKNQLANSNAGRDKICETAHAK
jgi:hypothetical protein